MVLYKFRAFEQLEYLLDIVFNERLYCAEYRNLNDPFEGMFHQQFPESRPLRDSLTGYGPMIFYRVEKSVSELLDEAARTRVCSLSLDMSDVRLWSLYAGGHTGVAVEIDFSSHEADVVKVHYESSLPNYYSGLLSPVPTADEILSFKTDQWAYESEYRVISDSTWYDVGGRVRRLIVGHRCSPERFKLLRRIVPGSLPITQASLDFDSVKVHVE